MRLINCDTGDLEDYTFRLKERPDYVIFSHRWLSSKDGGDVTFTEYNNAKTRDEARAQAGRKVAFAKLDKAMSKAKDVFNPKEDTRKARVTTEEGGAADETVQDVKPSYIWVDSCCINRDSSSKLSEALNSMWRYYSEAKECLVYLEDFKEPPLKFENIEWFKRGWTLQELIAPRKVTFYNHEWVPFGDRSDNDIAEAIQRATNIPKNLLTGKTEYWNYSVAQRMSWAAKRQTTREEDRSYSLFGLFNVHLTPIYGEGARNAFLRLQEAIMSQTTDLSLFAWIDTHYLVQYRGILARSPDEFSNSGSIAKTNFLGDNPEFSMTNKGLKIQPFLAKQANGEFFLPLNCTNDTARNGTVGIILRKYFDDGEVLHRYEPGKLADFDTALLMRDHSFWPKKSDVPIYIAKDERYLRKISWEVPIPENSRSSHNTLISAAARGHVLEVTTYGRNNSSALDNRDMIPDPIPEEMVRGVYMRPSSPLYDRIPMRRSAVATMVLDPEYGVDTNEYGRSTRT